MNNTPKTPVVSKKVLIPFILVTSLFALWGFANAVTDPMVNAFKKVLELTNTQASWVQMAFYGGYFCMALPAAMFMRKYSYKVGVLIGLGLYAGGALLFYPAAITEQFWFFCLGLYVLTFGLAFLETAANPYILAMGSRETATQRLNLAQSVNPIGLTAGLLVAKYFVYDREGTMPGLGETFKKLGTNSKYVLGVVAQILYVGGQIMTWTYIYQYAEAIDLANADVAGYEKIDVFAYQFVAFVLFTVGRIVGTAMLRFMSPGKLLMSFALLAGAFVLGAMFIESIFGLYCVVGISFSMSLMFPTIYGIALNDLTEEQSKVGSAGLVMAIVGGALLPMLQGMIIDAGGSGVSDTTIMGVAEVNFSFVLPLFCFVYIAWYGAHVFRKHENRIA